MSATNQTAVYGLPIFLGTDVPSWLTDWNGAMGDIDTAIAAAKAAADAAASTAGTAATDIVTINGQITSLQNTVGTHTTQIGTISGSINTINSLIGNGTPTTTDQTLVGAINELHADITANTFGTSVEVTSYVEGTQRFTCPSDGYCEIHTNNDGQTVTLYVNGVGVATVYGTADTRYDRTPIYVRKGMELSVASSSNGYAYYIPIA